MGKDDGLVKDKSEKDPQGFTHEQFKQYYKGVPVEYAVVKAHSRNGKIEAISGEVYDVGEKAVKPALSESAALQQALAFVGAKTYRWQDKAEEQWLKKQQNNPKATAYPKGELVICKDYIGTAKAGTMVLAYKFDIYATEPLSRDYIYVDAITGKVIHRNAIIKHTEGPADTKYSGTRTIQTSKNGANHVLRDPSRGAGVETYNLQKNFSTGMAIDFTDADNQWTAAEFDNANQDNAALDAHWGTQRVYDYFKNVHGRLGLDDADGKMTSYVHVGNNYNNAFWDGTAMYYGDGDNKYFKPLSSLDVVAHEFGHGVMQYTANLVYQDEPGALNEGFSDIWGAVIEHYAAPEKQAWLIAEDFTLYHPFMRSLSDPRSGGQPDTYKGPYWYTGTGDNGGVHINSGVFNYWFFLLSQGDAGTNDNGYPFTVAGIGIDKAARIAYRAQKMYLTANSQFPDARTATLQATADLFGELSNEVRQVANAWEAVGVKAPFNLVLEAGVPSETTIKLSWQALEGITSFSVERSLSPVSGFAQVASLDGSASTYTDQGLSTDNTYFYQIRVTPASGLPYYSPVQYLVLGLSSAPSGLTATANGNTVKLTWDDNTTDETKFLIERSTSATGGFVEVAQVDANTTTFEENLSTNKYYYRVRAIRSNGTFTLYAPIASVVTGNAILMSNQPVTTCDEVFMDPGGFDNYPLNQDFTQTLTPATAGYAVRVSFAGAVGLGPDHSLSIYDGASTNAPLIGTFTYSDLPGTVTARNAAGQLTFRFISAYSDGTTQAGWRAAITCVPIEWPTSVVATANGKTVSLSWTDNTTDEANFLIERSFWPTSGFVEIAVVAANTTTFEENLAANNYYFYRLRTRRADGTLGSYSSVAGVATSNNVVVMSTEPVTTCNALFLDPGGIGNYPINQDISQTFTPATPGSAIQVSFNAFDVSRWDYLYVYDGASVYAPLIGSYTGSALPATITARNTTGQLTFRIMTYSGVASAGWSAAVSCVPIDWPNNLAATANGKTISLTWKDNSSDETKFLIERSASATGGFVEIAQVNANITTFEEILPTNGYYFYRLRAQKSDNSMSVYTNVASVTVGNVIVMSNQPVTTCDALFLDQGGLDRYYLNQGITQTFSPATPGSAVQVTFNEFSVFPLHYLSIYNGASTDAPLIGSYNIRSASPGTVTAQNATGQLTFRFTSFNNTIAGPGWSATVSCVPILVAQAQQLTGNEDQSLAVTLTATGPTSPVFEIVSAPKHGTLSGTIPNLTYTPEANYFGEDAFTFKASANGFSSEPATVSLTINAVNDEPVLAGVQPTYTVNELTQLTFTATATDTDLPANTLAFSLEGAPQGATIDAATGAFSWTPTKAQGPGSFTFTVKVADNGTPVLSAQQQVTVTVNEVNVAPVLAGVPPTDIVAWGNALTFTATATDADLPANTLAFSLVNAPVGAAINAATGAFSWTPTKAQGPGSFTFTVKVTDNGTPVLSAQRSITVTVGKRSTALVYGGALTGQYSDIVNLTATLTDAANGTAISGRTVTFGLGTQNATAATLATSVASAALTLNQPAALATVTSAFAGDNLYMASTDNDPFAINRENAAVAYAGLEYFGTANSTSTVANVEYIATLTDTADGSRGVVTNAQARFAGGTSPRTVPVTLLTPGVFTVGTARTGIHTETLSQSEFSNGGKTFEMNVTTEGGFYTGQNNPPTLITVAVPGADFVNGGGSLAMAQSVGTFAATAGSRMNFGFTMKWNKSGRNIKGQANIIFRRLVNGGWRTYQIKSNAVNTLGTFNVTGGRRADFNTKANLTDITNPAAPVSLGGNMDLSVQAFESTDRTLRDQISVTLRNGGVLVFSSSWNGSASVMQNLSGGVVRVRSGAAITPTASRMSAEPTAQAASGQTGATAYPNPFRDRFTLRFGQEVTEQTVVSVFDLNGSLVTRQTIEAGSLATGLEVDLTGHRPGVYVVRAVAGDRTTVIKVVKQ